MVWTRNLQAKRHPAPGITDQAGSAGICGKASRVDCTKQSETISRFSLNVKPDGDGLAAWLHIQSVTQADTALRRRYELLSLM